ncbi:two-component system activity regulator YycH [Cohnella suwonensis]|uniref:Two-component system activity regulator YycH n=1 Tax=Cohnella suwonensis TaxID=696072 RepID=A0ABW0LRC0_9BACL
MIEKGKSVLLALLVVLSLVQSYSLAYNTPYKDAKVKSDSDYVKTERLGEEEKPDNLVFPEQLIIHLGDDKHTVFYPSTPTFYGLIMTKLKLREFKGLQRDSVESVDWDQIRKEDQGVELRFGRPVPFELLQKAFKIDGDFLFFGDSIDRIWIYSSKGRDEVRTFFFSSDDRYVYESMHADLTIGDVEGFVGFGQYWDPYSTSDGNVYAPDKPMARLFDMEVAYDKYTVEQMQDNLFDPGATRTIQSNKSGSQMYTDGKRGLKIEQDGTWLSYTDLVARTEVNNDLFDNVMSAIGFVDQHGGWNGKHLFVKDAESEAGDSVIRFQQYYKEVPIVSDKGLNFGYIQLFLEQGVVSTYNRSLVVLGEETTNKHKRELPGGEELRKKLQELRAGGRTVEALFPAMKPTIGEKSVRLTPAWAARLTTGEVVIVAESKLYA